MSEHRTLGEAVGGIAVSDAICYGALGLVVIGSLGPWVTTFVGSEAGTSSDGTSTLVLALGAAIASWCGWLRTAILAAAIAATGAIIDTVDVSRVAGNSDLVHTGWGLYATAAGAVVATIALSRVYLERRRA